MALKTISTPSIGLILLLICREFVANSAGPEECRENGTRVHLTRCDKYFQCVLLPSKRIIWVSKQCDEGLIYDKKQAQCVVPDIDWECELGDDNHEEGTTEGDPDKRRALERTTSAVDDQEIVYGVSNFDDYLNQESGGGAGDQHAEESYEANSLQYDGGSGSSERSDEFSGDDGTEVSAASTTEAISMEMPITPDKDGTVKSYLQRLTQLIDGFRKNGGSTEITPDQLNSFVVMHKIKSNKHYDSTGTLQLPENGKILKPHLDYILKKQYSLNTVPNQMMTTSTTTPRSPVHRRIIHIIRPYHRPEPEEVDPTRIVLKSQLAGGNGTGSNSQIVINRPEGSVLFNIARPVSESVSALTVPSADPSISQDTLKSVLELSKQLVSHQKYLSQKPNYFAPVYYAPIIQPHPGIAAPPSYSNNSFGLQNRPPHVRPSNYPDEGSQFDNNYNYNYQGMSQPEPSKIPHNYMSPGEAHHPSGGNSRPNYPSSGYFPMHHQEESQFHYARPSLYNNPHRPPYYDESGVGVSSNENNYYNPSHQSSDSGSHNLHDDADVGEGSIEELDDDETVKATETPTKPTPPPVSTLSNLQLLSQQLLLDSAGNNNKIIGINGNYMSYDTYKDTIMPILNTNSPSNLEVVACSAGIRHPNSSDCTRYYVCNPKNGDLLGYTCPPFTAFSELTRICDANSYALCKPELITTRFSIEQNKRLQYEAQKALQEAKRIRDQAFQTQLHGLKQKQGDNMINSASEVRPTRHKLIQTIKNTLKKKPNRRPNSTTNAISGGRKRKRRYKCADSGQLIPDVESRSKYFVCFRDLTGQFKRRSMACSKGLMFCSARNICTLKARC